MRRLLDRLGETPRVVRRDPVVAAHGGQRVPGAEHIAYPKEAYHRRMLPDVAEVFTSGHPPSAPGYHEALPPADPMRVRMLQVLNPDTVANVKAQIDRCYAEKSRLILTFHVIKSPATASTMYLPADFRAVTYYIAAKGVAVDRYGDVLARV